MRRKYSGTAIYEKLAPETAVHAAVLQDLMVIVKDHHLGPRLSLLMRDYVPSLWDNPIFEAEQAVARATLMQYPALPTSRTAKRVTSMAGDSVPSSSKMTNRDGSATVGGAAKPRKSPVAKKELEVTPDFYLHGATAGRLG